MNFLDKAKAKFDEFSDEVVRVMDTNDKKENNKQKNKKKERPKKSTKKKPVRNNTVKKPSLISNFMNKNPVEEETGQQVHLPRPKNNNVHTIDEPRMNFEVEEDFEVEEADSVFDLDENFETEFLQEKQDYFEAGQESYSNIAAPEVSGSGNIQDILDFLNISADVEIPSNVYMIEDIDSLVLNHQAPVGYDFGEVDSFKANVKESIKTYHELLEQRNEDIAKIASAMDKLQVDLNNTKYDLQVADGLSIMPTNESAALENALINEKIKNKELTNRLKSLESSGKQPLSDEATDFINALQDELALVKRENEDLTNTNFELNKRLQFLEENQEFVPQEVTDSYFDTTEEEQSNEFIEMVLPTIDENETPYESQNGGFNNPQGNDPFNIPEGSAFSIPEEDSFSLPEPDMFNQENNDNIFASHEDNNGGFALDNSSIDFLDDTPNTDFNTDFLLDGNNYVNNGVEDKKVFKYSDNDEDDLDELMSSWNN